MFELTEYRSFKHLLLFELEKIKCNHDANTLLCTQVYHIECISLLLYLNIIFRLLKLCCLQGYPVRYKNLIKFRMKKRSKSTENLQAWRKMETIILKKRRDIKVYEFSIKLFQSNIKTNYSYFHHLVARSEGFGWINFIIFILSSVKLFAF